MDNVNTTEPDLTDTSETVTAVIKAVVPMAEIAGFFDRSFSELAEALDRQGIAPTGPGFARYAGPPGETADLEVGFPVAQPLPSEGNVVTSSLPAGRVAHVVHVGGYERLGETWGRLAGWIAEKGLTPGADLWEVYVTEPTPETDPADLRTELFWVVS